MSATAGRAERQRVDVAIDRLHAEEAQRRDSGRARAGGAEPAAEGLRPRVAEARETATVSGSQTLKLTGYRVETLPRRRATAQIGVFDLRGARGRGSRRSSRGFSPVSAAPRRSAAV